MYKADRHITSSHKTTTKRIGNTSLCQFKSAQTPQTHAKSMKEVPANEQ